MRLITIVLTILIFSFACGRKVPEDIVPQQQMGALLLDMHLADGQLASMMADSGRVYRDAYYNAIFNRYGIDSNTFERSIEFYSTRPEVMKTLYINIEKQLEAYNIAEQQAIEAKYSAQRKADSIVNAKRTDSLWRVNRDSLDFKRKRFLLYLDGPDSLPYSQPVPITYMLLRERMMEDIRLRNPGELNHSPALPAKPLVPSVAPAVPAPEVKERTRPTLTPIKKIN